MDILIKDFSFRTTLTRLLLRKDENAQNPTRNVIKLEFVKKANLPNPVETRGYVKCHSSSSLRPIY